jgi:chromosome segregation ATPase|tara:strand:- start:2430 stop:2753 length:324 start_codon:yes stop_codon:yes gene_type:complete
VNDSNGWDKYSKLVLQQLETLSGGIEGLRAELQHVKEQLTELKAREDRVQDLKAWKEKIDEVASPSQLQIKFEEVEELKEFKTKAITMFMVVQTFMGIAMAWALEIF